MLSWQILAPHLSTPDPGGATAAPPSLSADGGDVATAATAATSTAITVAAPAAIQVVQRAQGGPCGHEPEGRENGRDELTRSS